VNQPVIHERRWNVAEFVPRKKLTWVPEGADQVEALIVDMKGLIKQMVQFISTHISVGDGRTLDENNLKMGLEEALQNVRRYGFPGSDTLPSGDAIDEKVAAAIPVDISKMRAVVQIREIADELRRMVQLVIQLYDQGPDFNPADKIAAATTLEGLTKGSGRGCLMMTGISGFEMNVVRQDESVKYVQFTHPPVEGLSA
jgi:hypothetical protein